MFCRRCPLCSGTAQLLGRAPCGPPRGRCTRRSGALWALSRRLLLGVSEHSSEGLGSSHFTGGERGPERTCISPGAELVQTSASQSRLLLTHCPLPGISHSPPLEAAPQGARWQCAKSPTIAKGRWCSGRCSPRAGGRVTGMGTREDPEGEVQGRALTEEASAPGVCSAPPPTACGSARSLHPWGCLSAPAKRKG